MSNNKNKRYPAEVRKQQIYDAFLDLMIERGYDSISLSTIAEKVGISKPAVYQHTGNKEQIFAHLLEEYRELNRHPIVFDIVDHSAIRTLQALYEAFCNGNFGSEKEMRLRLALFSRKETSDLLQDLRSEGNDLITETILPILIFGRDSGEIRTDVPPQELANIIWMWIYSTTALKDTFPRFHAPSFERCLEIVRAEHR